MAVEFFSGCVVLLSGVDGGFGAQNFVVATYHTR